MENIIGKRFGSWTVLEYNKDTCMCLCDCGVIKKVFTANLIRGLSKSCGCKRALFCKEMATKHGKKNTRLYTIWCNMKLRCNNPNSINYHNYGGRGIGICKEWEKTFLAFYEWAIHNGYSETLSIDRINVNGNYSPENCRWVDNRTQQRNRRNNHFISYMGKRQTLIEWSYETGIRHTTILERLKKGLDLNDVFYPGNLRSKYKKYGAKMKGVNE